MRSVKNITIVSVLSLIVASLFATQYLDSSTNALNTSAVVINEIMYNPISGLDDDEYIELYNRDLSSIDISGWCFTNGVSLCFPGGTVMSPQSYLVLSRNVSQTQATYGISASFTYTGKLDNGGERLVLRDSSNIIVSDFVYDDIAPWPVSPDGLGSSLELKDPFIDNAVAINWGGSITINGSLGSINSVANTSLPEAYELTEFTGPVSALASPSITVRTNNATSVELAYSVMFQPETMVPMFDDGLHNDGMASDGTFGAILPAQSAGSLVRYHVLAQNAAASIVYPGADDSLNSFGYFVEDNQSASIPTFHWFMDPAVFDDMITNHSGDSQQFSAVIYTGGIVYDNVKVNIKGGSSRDWPKKKFKFEMPQGHFLGQPYFMHPVDEFTLDAYIFNYVDYAQELGWRAYEHAGFPAPQTEYVSVARNTLTENSSFQGLYLLMENYDKSWRERNGYQEGSLYKERFEKKTRLDESDADINDLQDNLLNLSDDNLRKYLYDNIDIPNVINYHAITRLIRNNDWGWRQNLYQYRDTDGTGRWSYLPWDLDHSFQPTWPIDPGANPDPLDMFDGFQSNPSDYPIESAMYGFPEFREMLRRRMSTLYDEIYESGRIYDWYDEIDSTVSQTLTDDQQLWLPEESAFYQTVYPFGYPFGFPPGYPYPQQSTDYATPVATAQAQKNIFFFMEDFFQDRFEFYRQSQFIPESQHDSPRVVINEIMYKTQSGSSDDEYIELYNPGSTPVDVSGWYLDGVGGQELIPGGGSGLKLPQGSILPANGYAVVVGNDVSFRNAYGGALVLAEYPGDLDDSGEQIRLLSSSGSIVSRVDYGTNSPWPIITDNSGISIEFATTQGSESLGACWAPSSGVGGTPGFVNDPDDQWVFDYQGCVVLQDTTPDSSEPVNLVDTGQATNLAWASMMVIIITLVVSHKKTKFHNS